MPREGHRFAGGRTRGGVRPQPPEDLQADHQAGAQAEARAPVHHCAQGDLQPQVHAAKAGAQAAADPLVSGSHSSGAWRVLRRE